MYNGNTTGLEWRERRGERHMLGEEVEVRKGGRKKMQSKLPIIFTHQEHQTGGHREAEMEQRKERGGGKKRSDHAIRHPSSSNVLSWPGSGKGGKGGKKEERRGTKKITPAPRKASRKKTVQHSFFQSEGVCPKERKRRRGGGRSTHKKSKDSCPSVQLYLYDRRPLIQEEKGGRKRSEVDVTFRGLGKE